MRFTAAVFLLIPAVLVASAASPPAAKSKAKSKAGTTSAHSARTAKKRKVSRRRSAGPSYQTHPTAERYKEIQQTLADKGYFKGDVNGMWGNDSAEALKHFQSDHQLVDDGKINSLSLIQLGLGPKHETIPARPGNSPETTLPLIPSVTEAPSGAPESQ